MRTQARFYLFSDIANQEASSAADAGMEEPEEKMVPMMKVPMSRPGHSMHSRTAPMFNSRSTSDRRNAASGVTARTSGE
jgi:hypothetical protein